MSGEDNLGVLLGSLTARLVEGTFVFVTLPDGSVPSGLRPQMVFREGEGATLIILQSEAEARGFGYEFPCRMITLNVHSSLEAVGFIARIASELAQHGIGVNPVAGYFHDHLFVPKQRAHDALAILEGLAGSDP